MKARVLIGGWSWKGDAMTPGLIIDAPSAAWIANRVADGGLVEAVEETVDAPAAIPPAADPGPAAVEAAVVAPSETATQPRASAKRKP
jgi:hypothetical protein